MYHELIEKGQSDLIIIFSSIDCEPSKFRFYRAFINNNADLLFLNCKNNDWFLNGIPSLGEDLDSSLLSIKRIIEKNKYERVVTFGSSMGAFGAIMYGSSLNVDKIFAGCPELKLGSDGGFYSRFNDGKLDFRDEIRKFSGEVNIFLGEESYFDISQSSYLSSDNINIYILNGESHGVFEAIEFDIGCGNLINCYLSGIDLETIGFRKDHEYTAYSRIFNNIQNKIRKKLVAIDDIRDLKKILSTCFNNRVKSHASFLISVIYMNNNDFSSAKEYSLQACLINSKSPRILCHHFRVCDSDNDFLSIISFRNELKAILASKSPRYLENMRSKKIKEAVSFFNKATKVLGINGFLKV